MNKQMKQYKMSFGEWLLLWFETFKRPNLQPTSIRNIEQIIRLHTPAWLKAKPIATLTPLDMEKALAELPRGRTCVYTRQVWHSAFLKAYKLGYVSRNIMELVDPVKYKKQKGKALTIGEQREFLKALEGKRYKWLMLFYLYSGVRRTEALTLQWSDIDESEELILIRGTKTADSYRHIVLTSDLKYILMEQRKQNERDRGTRYESKTPEKVFNYSQYYVSQIFKKVCPAHHLHDLRHTYITRCAESGVNVTVCQQLVGHSTAELTLNVYTHVMDEFKRKEALKYTIFPDFGIKKDGE